ncbi:TetR/AcrR family transcriptional regulator [Brevundimonas sp.]|uniref:TetR/AcrR family transcriptional regulator n=1 Tax=Brevundimonas sp. TaxID=1871086 RepID=UPI0025B89AD7|nr:TetR/AcrR family transcriptional regulator [Brevundimonas sp.]
MPRAETIEIEGSEPFRTRVGREKRARTRARILAAAFGLFDERGMDRVTVDDVRDAAGLARGSFYNYFSTYEDMLKDMAATITAQLNTEQSLFFDHLTDPAERICRNIQYTILRLSSDPSCSGVMVRVTPLIGPATPHMRQHAEASMRQAQVIAAIDVPSPAVAMDMGYGLVVMLIRRAMTDGLAVGDIEAAGLMLLRAFGVPEDRAQAIAAAPLPTMPKEPLRHAIIQAGL